MRKRMGPLPSLPEGLAEQIVDWVRRHHDIRLNDAVEQALVLIISRAAAYDDCTTLIKEAGEQPNTVRGRLTKKGLPLASRWFHLARGLALAAAIQELSGTPLPPLLELGQRVGYFDHTGLSHGLRRQFGVTIYKVHTTPGWEWLLERWWERQRASALGR